MTIKISKLLKGLAPKVSVNVPDLVRKAAGGPERVVANYQISTYSEDEHLVTGQVYAPDTLDSHGHFMSAKELKAVAHNFMLDGLTTSIDVQHDNRTIDACIVETFIARAGDPEFEEGAWVATTKINDPAVWDAVKRGEINGYSFEILTYREDLEVEFEYKSWYYGFTDPDPTDKHTHPFIVRMGEDGEILWGKTGLGTNGEPGHTIHKSNVTDPVDGLTHRIHLR